MKKNISLLPVCLFISLFSIAQNVGIGTTNPKTAFHVAQNKSVLFGNDSSGSGIKLLWIPSRASFRSGVIGPIGGHPDFSGDIWNPDSIGYASFAAGVQCRAPVQGAIAMGYNIGSYGAYSVTLGYDNMNRATESFTAGSHNAVSGMSNITLGVNNSNSGTAAMVIGNANIATSNLSAVVGSFCENYGFNSFVAGHSNRVNASQAFVGGRNNIVNSEYATVFGLFNDSIAGSHPDDWNINDPLFMIGNGNSNENRKNAMVMLKNGRTGFGTNTPAGTLHVKGNSSMGVPEFMVEEQESDFARISFRNLNPGYWDIAAFTNQILSPGSDSRFNIYFSGINANVMSLHGNGNVVVAGTLTQSSDERLKKNIVPLRDVLSRLQSLNAYTYQWNDSLRGKEIQLGFLAQEIEKEFPELVHADEKGMKSVAYSNMVPVLLEAIKELKQEIDQLKKSRNN